MTSKDLICKQNNAQSHPQESTFDLDLIGQSDFKKKNSENPILKVHQAVKTSINIVNLPGAGAR